jgi:hypothetical protein
MADQPLHLRTDADLETALRALADAIDWPVAGPAPAAAGAERTLGGPDLASVVRARIEAGDAAAARRGPSRWSWSPARRLAIAAVLVLLTLAVLAAIAGAAGLGLPGLRIFLGPAPVSPPPSVAPSPSTMAGPPGSTLPLGERVDLADLDARAGFDVRWPDDPAIGPPDAAYIDPAVGGQVSLVWAPKPGLPETFQSGVGLVMTAVRGAVDDGFFTKVVTQGTKVRPVFVDDERAYWLSGAPHFFFYETGSGQIVDPRRWVGDALLWADGPITYRLETSLGPDRAVEIAESVP